MSTELSAAAMKSGNAKTAYDTLCTSYHGIDDFRGKLLGFLPLATGGIFLLAEKDVLKTDHVLALSFGIFGFLITLGLFIFELYGIRKCTHLIILGKHLEHQLGIEGQFLNRPDGLEGFLPWGFARLISEPMASGLIYPAVSAAWLYLALQGLDKLRAGLFAIAVFVLGIVASYRYNNWLLKTDGPNQMRRLEHTTKKVD
jgi:hypothetical protein